MYLPLSYSLNFYDISNFMSQMIRWEVDILSVKRNYKPLCSNEWVYYSILLWKHGFIDFVNYLKIEYSISFEWILKFFTKNLREMVTENFCDTFEDYRMLIIITQSYWTFWIQNNRSFFYNAHWYSSFNLFKPSKRGTIS